MKSHKKIFLFTTFDPFVYATINSVNPLYIIISEINECIEGNNESKYLTLVPTNENKNTLEKYEELWSKIRYLIGSITNN